MSKKQPSKADKWIDAGAAIALLAMLAFAVQQGMIL